MTNRFIIGVALIALCLSVGGASSRLQAQQSEGSAKLCLDRKKQIDAELASSREVPWVGEYRGHMAIFSLAPSAGFFYFQGSDYIYSSCAWGSVKDSDGAITLVPDPSVPIEATRGLAIEWMPVKWGDRRYIIPKDGILDFVNSVNNGYEPAYRIPGVGASFLNKAGDEDRRVSGFPEVPTVYLRYLLKTPIRGRVTAVGTFQVEKMDSGGTETRSTNVTLNVGARQGVLVGMRFVTYKPRLIHEDIVVTEVLDDRSKGIVRQQGRIYDQPSTKWKISTSIRDIK